MDRLRSEWANTPARSRIILGIGLAAVLVFAALSFTGIIDFNPVSTGVVEQVKKTTP